MYTRPFCIISASSQKLKGHFSLNGRPEYFDCVVGVYRSERPGKLGHTKMWEYPIPGECSFASTDSILTYRSRKDGLWG